MNRKRICVLSLVGFFSLGGMFGFNVAVPHGEHVYQATPPPVESTLVATGLTEAPAIPVTAQPEPVWTEILVFYGMIGLTTLFMILALLNLANKSTVQHAEHNTPSPDKTPKK